MLGHLRSCLRDRDFLELVTPVARKTQVPIANRPKVDLAGGRFLRTMIGPALRSTLKHHSRVFEIGPCFRDDPADMTHSPEFTMLDLYAADESFDFLLNLALVLVAPAVRGEVVSISVAEVIKQRVGIDLSTQTVESAICELASAADCDPHEAPERIVDSFIEKIVEPKTNGCAAVVHDYPLGGSEPCARSKPGAMGVARRFEIFIEGIEVAHGYEDEIDLKAFAERAQAVNLFDEDQERIVNEINNGDVPLASVGMGIGVERLCMAVDGMKDIWKYRFGSAY